MDAAFSTVISHAAIVVHRRRAQRLCVDATWSKQYTGVP